MNILVALLVVVPLACGQLTPGGRMKVDVHRDDVQKMATEAITMMNQKLGTQNTLVQVLTAYTQVVAGTNYFLSFEVQSNGMSQICNITVWSRPWLNDDRITHHYCSAKSKRAFGLLGGYHHLDANTPVVQEIASFALGELNALQNTKGTLIQVVSAQSQIVAGTDYFLTLEMNVNGMKETCAVMVLSQPWLHKKTMTNHKCSHMSARSLLGGHGPLLGGTDPAHLSLSVQKAVHFAEDMLNSKSNSMYREVTQSVDHVSRQIVAGIKYTFDLHMVASTCRNSDTNMGKGINDCPVTTDQNSLMEMTCHVEVLYQAWMKTKYHLVSDSCSMA